MPRSLFGILIALVSWIPCKGLAQPGAPAAVPAAQVVLESWRDAQARASRAAGLIAFEETLERVTELPRGRMSLRMRSLVAGDPALQNWSHEILEATRNGRPVPVHDLPHPDDRGPDARPGIGRGQGDSGTRLLYPPALSRDVFRRIAVRSEPERDVLNGQEAWRLELTATQAGPRERRPGGPPRIETVTVWFSDGDPPRLLRASVKGRHPRTNAPSTREVLFGPFGDLDVPLRSRFESQVEQHRRIRSYTRMSTVEVWFSEYRRISAP